MCDMDVNRKRITLKRARPNPLFEDWLEELHEEAKLKKSKKQCMLKEALNSLSKYPLPLQTGEECAILKGFDNNLCSFLDKRLEEYENSSACNNNSSSKLELHTILTEELPIDINNVSISESSPTQTLKENLQVISEKNITNTFHPVSTETIVLYEQQDEPELQVIPSDIEIIDIILPDTHCTSQSSQTDLSTPENSVAKSSQRVRKNKIKYKPIYRSASYAILMAFLEHINVNSKQPINRIDLLELAHKYSEDSMTRPTDDTRHYLWTNVGKLITKELVKKIAGEDPKYILTDLGHATALELYEETKLKQKMDEMKSKKSGNSQKGNNEPEINILNDSRVVINKEIIDVEEDIVFESGSYEIVLLIDINESIGLSKMNDPIMIQIKKYPKLKHEYRCLSVGDFTWMARHKTTKQELVLPYIIERKRMDDLAASIKDGRFHEQKFRLKKCGANVIYMVENYYNNKNVGLPMTTLMQGLVNTRVQDGFKVHITESLVGSVRFLAILTMRLIIEYQDSKLKGHNKKAEGGMLMTFDFFMKYFIKNKPLSIKYTFIKLLLQIKGLSVERALAITNKYKTPKLLIKAYDNCEPKEGESLLAQLRCENNRTVGATISKTVYQLFTSRELS